MKIAVIGAGPAGITAAYILSKEIKNGKITCVDVYEADPQVGGLAKSMQLWNQTVDLGPHRFFSHDKIVNNLWLEVAGDDYAIVNRLTRIYYKNKFYFYPIRALNALKNLGIFEAGLCVLSYLIQKVLPSKKEDNFESWVTDRFGKRLYTIFFKTYSEKLWGIKCTELDSDFASQRIKKLSLYETIKNAIIKDKKQKHKTLVEQFAYPLKGTGSIYKKMEDKIRENNGQVFLKTPVERVLTYNNKVTGLEFPDGKTKEYDIVISTMPLSMMVKKLPGVPAKISELADSLKYRSTILVYLNIDNIDLFPDQWLYIHSKNLGFGRLTNFRNWVRSLYNNEKTSVICMEYWCYLEDDFWNKDDNEIAELAKNEIRETNLISDAKIIGTFIYRIPRCYPVYFKGYAEVLKPIEQYLDTINGLHVIGRYGAYKYNNQDHSILMGIMAAENVLYNAGHNIWAINTDYENYQEQAIISGTGLVEKG